MEVATDESVFPVLLSLGFLFFLALGVGRVFARMYIPKVTGYLLVGLAAGPSFADLLDIPEIITREQLEVLDPLHDLTLGLIVVVIGGNFRLAALKKFGAGLLRTSAMEIGLTAFLVGGVTYLAGASPVIAGFLALMAITTAPAATQMVVREYESEGPLTDTVMILIGLNNLIAIIAFVLLAHGAVTPDAPLLDVAFKIFVPMGIGVVAGAIMAVMDQRLTRKMERQILALAAIAALVGMCRYLEISAMLASLVTGAVLVNTSPNDRRILKDLNAIDYPLYMVFFIMAGAHLQVGRLGDIGLIGGAYIVARIVGKVAGCWVGARPASCPGTARNWLGPAMLAQAGLAIGLAAALARDWGLKGEQVQTVVLASVVVFEGLGPLLTRVALVRAGEVTVLSLLVQRSPVGYAEGLHEVINKFKETLGIFGGADLSRPSDILVSHVMRKNVETIRSDISFDRVLKAVGHSRYDRLPVLNRDDELIGVIQYSDVSEVLFDPSLRNLIVAGDIVTEEHLLLTPGDNLEKAMNELRAHPDHTYLLVVDEDNPKKLVGVVRHNDVLSVQRKIRG